MCSTACWSSDARPTSASPNLDGAGVLAPPPLIHATRLHLAPGPAPSRAMLLDQPLARAAQLQARAVHQQVHGLGAGPWSWDLQGLGSAAQSGVVRDGEIKAKQAHEGADQPFGLAQR